MKEVSVFLFYVFPKFSPSQGALGHLSQLHIRHICKTVSAVFKRKILKKATFFSTCLPKMFTQ